MPDALMRKLLSGHLVLILALNGIACACPLGTGEGDATPQQHEHHQSQAEINVDCHSDECDSACDDVNVIQGETAAIASSSHLTDIDNQAPAVTATIIDERWRHPGLSLTVVQAVTTKTIPTPVSLRDRLLC